MAQKRLCIYNKNHILPIFDKNGLVEEKTLNLTIMNINETVEIKIRDPTKYYFNYSENIDLADFEAMRNNQSLDINFAEFKFQLLEMLQQFQQNEMFLKCMTSDSLCTLVFYGKSKIKSIIYLTVDLHSTNQQEILSELINNLQQIQEINEKLKRQLSNSKKNIAEKEEEIKRMNVTKCQFENVFHNNLKQIEDGLSIKLTETENIFAKKIMFQKKRIMKLCENIDFIKKETILKSDSSARLLKTMESLRLETIDNAALINHLKRENNNLHTIHTNYEKSIMELRKNINENEATRVDLYKKNEELRTDLEKATVIMTQQKSTIDELSKDLVQANQMLVNFDNHYDSKVKQIGDLHATLECRDRVVNEQRLKYNDLLQDYENYKSLYNSEIQERFKNELLIANNKISELENSLRKANKINTLLTEKVNNQHRQF